MPIPVVVLLALVLPAVAVAGAVTRRPAAEPDGDGVALRYGPAWRLGAIAALAAPVALGALAWSRRGALAPDVTAAALALCLLQLAVSAALCAEVLGVRHRLTREGIVRRSPWARAPLTLRWGEIARVRWSAAGQWLVVEAEDGRRVRFSPLLDGLGDLAVRLTGRAGVPPERLEAGAGARLAAWVLAREARGGR